MFAFREPKETLSKIRTVTKTKRVQIFTFKIIITPVKFCEVESYEMPYELFPYFVLHNSNQYSHIVKLTLHFYAHIGAGH